MSEHVDPVRFERAACALLRPQYPGLSPIEGGTDLGRDADIYEHGDAEDPSTGRLLATTGDPVKNLDRGLRRMAEEGLHVAHLVIACSLQVTAKTRQRLEARCQRAGLGLPHIYGRDRFIQLLVASPDWCEYLLGIRGRLESISRTPVNFLGNDTTLVGRDVLVAELRDLISSGTDIIVSGVPGVGKTRLVHELDGNIGYLQPMAVEHVVDDLHVEAPDVVVLDDAHLNVGALQRLTTARRQEGFRFSIVAMSWPADADSVRRELPTAAEIDVRLMRRDDLDAIVRSTGVSSHWARHLVLEQADGRPGWAITLAKTIIEGNGQNVASGATLLDQVERHIQSVADSAVTLDAVACIAALGSADASDLERVSLLVGVPHAQLASSLRNLASDGLLTLERDRWRLQPGLSAPLVLKWFFRPGHTRSWSSLHAAFPDRQHELDLSMLEAAGTSRGELPPEAEQWRTHLPPIDQWNESTLRAVRAYSTISKRAANFAARAAITILEGPRTQDISPWGTVSDPVGDQARKLLTQAVHQWFERDAVKAMLTLSLTDTRNRHGNSDHPMRSLNDMVGHLGPDGESYFDTREMLVEYASEWLADDPSADRVTIWCEAIAAAFSPHVEGSWTLPSNRYSIQIADGIEAPRRLHSLLKLWSRVDETITAFGILPPQAVIHLLSLFEEWLRLAGGVRRRQTTPNEEQRREGELGAWRIYETVLPQLVDRPGLALRARRELDLAERWEVRPPTHLASLHLDPDLVLLAGRRDVGEDPHDWLERRRDEICALADRIAQMPPDEGIDRIASLEAESAHLKNGPGVGPLTYQLASTVSDPAAWLEATVSSRCAAGIAPFLAEARRRGAAVPAASIVGLLDDSVFRDHVVRAVLSGGVDDLAEAVLTQLTAADASHVEAAMFHRDYADAMSHRLLTHSVPEVAAAASLCFKINDEFGVELPAEWSADWAKAFILSTSLHDRNSLLSYRQSEILKHLAEQDPTLCVEWFDRLLSDADRDADDTRYSDFDDLHEVVVLLPRDARSQIAHMIPNSRRGAMELLRPLTVGDPRQVADLIRDGIDPEDFLLAIQGHLDDQGEMVSAVLLAEGVRPDRIARALTGFRSWMGNESDDLARMIDWFKDLRSRRPELRPIADAALPGLHTDRERVLAEEEREAIHGFL